LRRALELLPVREKKDLAELQAELGAALEHAGRSAEAAEAYLAAAEQGRGEQSAELRLRAAEQLLLGGRYAPGIALLHQALPQFGVKLSRGGSMAVWSLLLQRARLAMRGVKFVSREESKVDKAQLRQIDACYAASSSLGAIDSLVAAEVQTRGVLLALNAGEPVRVLRALIYESGFRSGANGGQARTAELLERARTVATQIGRPEAMAMLDFGLGFYEHHGLGNLKNSATLLTRSEAVLEGAPGMNAELAILRCSVITAFDWLGDVHTLEQRLPGLMADAERRGDHLLLTSLVCAPLFWLARDRADDLAHYLESSRKLWPEHTFVMPAYWFMVAEAHRDLYLGHGRACVERVQRMWPDLQRSYYLSIPTVRIEISYPRARGALMCALEGHEPKAMLRLAESDLHVLEGTHRNYALALAKLLKVSIAAVRGERESLPALLKSAAKACSDADLTVHAAVARKELGELLGGDEGKRLVQSALRALRELGVHDADKMARALLPGLAPRG
jgi:hypothetical protein